MQDMSCFKQYGTGDITAWFLMSLAAPQQGSGQHNKHIDIHNKHLMIYDFVTS